MPQGHPSRPACSARVLIRVPSTRARVLSTRGSPGQYSSCPSPGHTLAGSPPGTCARSRGTAPEGGSGTVPGGAGHGRRVKWPASPYHSAYLAAERQAHVLAVPDDRRRPRYVSDRLALRTEDAVLAVGRTDSRRATPIAEARLQCLVNGASGGAGGPGMGDSVEGRLLSGHGVGGDGVGSRIGRSLEDSRWRQAHGGRQTYDLARALAGTDAAVESASCPASQAVGPLQGDRPLLP